MGWGAHSLIMNAWVNIKSLEKKLPLYVANYLKAAGFDSVNTICSMDVSEHRENLNTVYVIENYATVHINIYSQIQVVLFSINHSNFHQAIYQMQIINFVRELKNSKVGQNHKFRDPTVTCKAKI